MSFPSSDTHSPRGPPSDRQQPYKYYTSHSQASHHSPSIASSHTRGHSHHSNTSSATDVEQARNGGGTGLQQHAPAHGEEGDDGGWTVDWKTPAFERVDGRMKRKKAPRAALPTTFGIMHSALSPPYPSVKGDINSSTSTRAFINRTPDLSHSSTSLAWEDIQDSPVKQESPLPALRADLEKEEKEEEKLAAEALPPQSARPPHSAGSGETANEHTTQHNGETPTIDGTAHAAANADGGDLPIHAIVSDMTAIQRALSPLPARASADGGWHVDASNPSTPAFVQPQQGDDGGWSVDDKPAPVHQEGPRRVRTLPSAPAAIRNWLGTLPDTPPLHHSSSIVQPVHGGHYTQPIQRNVPAHVLDASLHDPNRDPIGDPKQWGSVDIAEQSGEQPEPGVPAHPSADIHRQVSEPQNDEQEGPASSCNPFGPGAAPDFGQLDLKQAADANAAATPLEGLSPGEDDGGWSKDAAVKRWAQNVESAPPVETATEQVSEMYQTPSVTPLAGPINIDDLPPRPASVAPVPPPITVYVSDDDGSEADSPLPTPRAQGRFGQPLASPTVVQARQCRDDTPHEDGLPAEAETTRKAESTYDGSQMTETRRDREYRYTRRRAERNGVYWKKPPHPAFAPQFADRRILVQFPFSIRISSLTPMLSDHMARFGSLRMVWTLNETGSDATDRALVIYDEQESVAAFMAAADRNICISRSPNRAGTTKFEVQTSIAPVNLFAKTVYIKVTGARGDSRSRSASPSFYRSDGGRSGQEDPRFRPLPLGVYIDAVPHVNRYKGKLDYWARVRLSHVDFESVDRRAFNETNQHARELVHVDLGRRVSEKEFIPRICDYFADVIEVIQSASRDGGWLVSVCNVNEARQLIYELNKITGLTVRMATRNELHGRHGSPPPGVEAATDTPRGQRGELEVGGINELERLAAAPTSTSGIAASGDITAPGRIVTLEVDSDGWPKTDGEKVEDVRIKDESADHQVDGSRPGHQADAPADAENTNIPSAATRGESAAPDGHGGDQQGDGRPSHQPHNRHEGGRPSERERDDQSPDEGGDPQQPNQHQYAPYHGLTKRLEYTYRGRVLRMDNTGSEPRFFDDAGVFVGRFSQEREDAHSLFARFSRYGYICDIEYKVVPSAAYGSARILFGDVSSAQRALAYETGATNYGSVLKIDKRRVLQTDVELKEYMVDDFGRAYSPTMEPQYTPPRQGTFMPTTVPASFPRPDHPLRAAPMPTGPAPPHAPFTHTMFQPSSVPTMSVMQTAPSAPPAPPTWPWPVPQAQPHANEAITNGMNAILYALGVTYWPGEGPPPPVQPPRPHASPVVPRHAPPPPGPIPAPMVTPVPAQSARFEHPMTSTQPAPGFAVPISPMEPLTARLPVHNGPAFSPSPVPPVSADNAGTGQGAQQQVEPASTPDARPADASFSLAHPSESHVEPAPHAASLAAPGAEHLKVPPTDPDVTPLTTPRAPRRGVAAAAPPAVTDAVESSAEVQPPHPASASPSPPLEQVPERSGSPVFPRLSTPDRNSDSAISTASNLGSSTTSSRSLRVKKSIITPSGLYKWVYEDEDYERHCRETGKEHRPFKLREEDGSAEGYEGDGVGHGDPALHVQQAHPAPVQYVPSTSTQGHPPAQSPHGTFAHIDPDAQVAISPHRPFAALSASSSTSGGHDSPYRLDAPPRPFEQRTVPPSASAPIMQTPHPPHPHHRPNPVPIPFVDQIPLQSAPNQWANQPHHLAHSPVHSTFGPLHPHPAQPINPGRLSSANNSMAPPGFQRQWGAPNLPDGGSGGPWYGQPQPQPHRVGRSPEGSLRGPDWDVSGGFNGQRRSGPGSGTRMETGSDGWERPAQE